MRGKDGRRRRERERKSNKKEEKERVRERKKERRRERDLIGSGRVCVYVRERIFEMLCVRERIFQRVYVCGSENGRAQKRESSE